MIKNKKRLLCLIVVFLGTSNITTVNSPADLVESMQENQPMKVSTGINLDNRKAVTQILNSLLADLYVLYQKTWGFHWNVTGPFFNDLHSFFQTQFEQLRLHIDDVAERVLQLGFFADSTLVQFRKNSRLSEEPGAVPDSQLMVEKLLSDHEHVIRTLRQNIDQTVQYNDMGTNNLLTDLMQRHEKMAWKLRAINHKK